MIPVIKAAEQVDIIKSGETSRVQLTDDDKIVAEMIVRSNAKDGIIILHHEGVVRK
ncbi:MAG: hypothetical protein LBS79_02885 [Tannerella sp.]|jgi:hypothetical protein|nr:hypothetical protein [Tannerella sp.]